MVFSNNIINKIKKENININANELNKKYDEFIFNLVNKNKLKDIVDKFEDFLLNNIGNLTIKESTFKNFENEKELDNYLNSFSKDKDKDFKNFEEAITKLYSIF
jgi:hypothetical protein